MLQLGATGIEGEEEEDSWFAVLLGPISLYSVAWRGKLESLTFDNYFHIISAVCNTSTLSFLSLLYLFFFYLIPDFIMNCFPYRYPPNASFS
jgi:hypothetical protein